MRKGIGIHLAYSHFIANCSGDSDHQAFFGAGVCMRVMRLKILQSNRHLNDRIVAEDLPTLAHHGMDIPYLVVLLTERVDEVQLIRCNNRKRQQKSMGHFFYPILDLQSHFFERMKKAFIHMATLVIACLIQVTTSSQKNHDRNSKLSFGPTFYHIKDCPCQFEPKAGYPYYPSFGTMLSYQDNLFRKLQMRFSLGIFGHSYFSTGVNNSFLHGSGILIYTESTHKTRNYFMSGHLGLSLSGKRLEVIPEIGFFYFRRNKLKSVHTEYRFTNLYDEDYIVNQWPDVEPTRVSQYESNNPPHRWDSMAGSIGLTGYYKLTQRLLLNFYGHILTSNTWVKDYHYSLHFVQAGAGIAIKLGKTNGLND